MLAKGYRAFPTHPAKVVGYAQRERLNRDFKTAQKNLMTTGDQPGPRDQNYSSNSMSFSLPFQNVKPIRSRNSSMRCVFP